jgi:glycosyltransferase involved in cell wall biosynthesis
MDDQDIYEHSVSMRLGLRSTLRRARSVTGCSAFVIDDAVRRFGLPPGKGHVIFNGVEIEGDEAPRALDLPFTRFVLALGRVVPKKGLDLLVEAFASVAYRHNDVGLVIGGDGPARKALVAQVDWLGLAGRVILPGRFDRSEVAWAMSHAEVFVLPSRIEPFGIVVLEAMRVGLPVVISSRGGAPEIVRHEREGLIVDPFDVSELGSAISRLLDDTLLAARLGARARQRVEDFSWSRITDQYLRLYQGILGLT